MFFFLFLVQANKQLASSGADDIIYQVGWVSERPIAAQNTMTPWKPRFAGVRAENVYVFDTPPVSVCALTFLTSYPACQNNHFQLQVYSFV